MHQRKKSLQEINITLKQREILLLLFRFRFLSTRHIQQLLKHKNPKRIQVWLKDLTEKKYVKRHLTTSDFVSNATPAIYYLAPGARKIIAKEKKIDLSDLEYIYSEHRRELRFITHCQFLADVYLYLLAGDQTEKITFFTKASLKGYEYFPSPLPDAFISVQRNEMTTHYFLDVFDDFTPPFVFRKRVKMYLKYAEKPDWEENTDATPFPKILLVLPSESAKKHVYKYASALLGKTFDDTVELFLTCKNKIQIRESENIWQKVVS